MRLVAPLHQHLPARCRSGGNQLVHLLLAEIAPEDERHLQSLKLGQHSVVAHRVAGRQHWICAVVAWRDARADECRLATRRHATFNLFRLKTPLGVKANALPVTARNISWLEPLTM